MRDPERITRILEKLRVLWGRNSDWRFSQLFENVRTWGQFERFHDKGDTFFLEDDEFERLLDKWVRMGGGL